MAAVAEFRPATIADGISLPTSPTALRMRHKSQPSHDSGAYIDWNSEDVPGPSLDGKSSNYESNVNGEFVTVVAVEPSAESPGIAERLPFVTVLSIGEMEEGDQNMESEEDVSVYRLPGERLGFGLKFEGGSNVAEKVTKLLIQSCAADSPASRSKASWGYLSPGDEITKIDDIPVVEMTRVECVRRLKESNVVLKLTLKRGCKGDLLPGEGKSDVSPPPVPPRKNCKKSNKYNELHEDPQQQHQLQPAQPQLELKYPKKSPKNMRKKFSGVEVAETYSDALGTECPFFESESDDTGSSMSTVVDKFSSSAPTTSNSSFSDGRSVASLDAAVSNVCQSLSPTTARSRTVVDLDKVLEPFLQLEREFSSSVTMEDTSLFEKLVAAASAGITESNVESTKSGDRPLNTNVIEQGPDMRCVTAQEDDGGVKCVSSGTPIAVPVPLPRRDIPKPSLNYGKRRPPPPPPPKIGASTMFPTPPERQQSSTSECSHLQTSSSESESATGPDHLPRLIDFVPKDRTDVIAPSAIHPTTPVDMLMERQRLIHLVHQEQNQQHFTFTPESNDFQFCDQVPPPTLPPSSDQYLARDVPNKMAPENVFAVERKMLEIVSPTSIKCHNGDDCKLTDNREDIVAVRLPERMDEQSCNHRRVFPPVQAITLAKSSCGGKRIPEMEPVLNATSAAIPPTYSRMPPDGHEFPSNYREIGLEFFGVSSKSHPVDGGPVLSENISPIASKSSEDLKKEMTDDCQPPPLPISEPPPVSSLCMKKIIRADVTNEAKLLDVERKYPTSSSSLSTNNGVFGSLTNGNKVFFGTSVRGGVVVSGRAHPWRNDEKSQRSVKDKIAMFSTAIDENMVPDLKGTIKCSSANQNGYPIVEINKRHGANVAIRCNVGMKTSHKGTHFNRAQSSVDLTLSSSSSAYSSCSPEPSTSPMSSPSYTIGSSSTLPRKHKPHCINAIIASDKKHAVLSRATSFAGSTNLHARSQSLIDVMGMPPAHATSGNGLEDGRRDSLSLLIEQRRKTMSKLRGLVIPERVNEAGDYPSHRIIDLPEIKNNRVSCDHFNRTSNSYYTSQGVSFKAGGNLRSIKSFTKNDGKIDQCDCIFPIGPTTTTEPSAWKGAMDFTATELPKYSPAFKRKTLAVYGVTSSASSSLSSSREELRMEMASKISSKISPPAKPPRTSIGGSLYGHVACKIFGGNNITANDEESKNERGNIKGLENGRKKLEASKGLEDSDNDSAVSSSRSSVCQEFSPPVSPSPESQNEFHDGNPNRVSPSQSSSRTLRRTLSSDTTESVASSTSTLTSGSRASCSSSCSSNEGASKDRVENSLRAENLVNRRNVLSLAKYSCGHDVKTESDVKNGGFSKGNETAVEKFQVSTSVANATNPIIDICQEESNWFDKDDDDSESDVKFKSPRQYLPADKNFSIYTDRDVESECSETDAFNVTTRKEKYASPLQSLSDGAGMKQSIRDVQPKIKMDEWDSKASSSPLCISNSRLGNTPKRSVNDIKKAFEKPVVNGAALPSTKISLQRPAKANGFAVNNNSHVNNNKSNNNIHLRMSSLDSTTSEDSFGSLNLLTDQQFGSISSLASSTSLISQQELQQLIEEANQTLEETTGAGSFGHDVMVVILHRDTSTSTIGITLAGGSDYEAKEITVHKILVGSAADRDGRIQKGDRILSINGRNMKGVTHREALTILKTPRPEVVLVISRWRIENSVDSIIVDSGKILGKSGIRPPRIPENVAIENDKFKETIKTMTTDRTKDPGIIVTLKKDGAGLGFSLEGGKDSPFGDLPLMVKKIFTGGCAEKSGCLLSGDKILSINGSDVTNMSRTEAWNFMKRLPDGEVTMNVQRSFK